MNSTDSSAVLSGINVIILFSPSDRVCFANICQKIKKGMSNVILKLMDSLPFSSFDKNVFSQKICEDYSLIVSSRKLSISSFTSNRQAF